jgi:hypothetical protein
MFARRFHSHNSISTADGTHQVHVPDQLALEIVAMNFLEQRKLKRNTVKITKICASNQDEEKTF